MAYCEDAPCCGCCGPLLDAADDLAAQERHFDRLNGWGEDEVFDYDEDDEDAAALASDEGAEDAFIDSYMESALMGEL